MPPRIRYINKDRKGCLEPQFPHDCSNVAGAHPKQRTFCTQKRAQCKQTHEVNQLTSASNYRRKPTRLPPVEVHDLTGDATAAVRQLYEVGIEHVPRVARAS